MSYSTPDPTPDQLAAMAYVDGELPSAERSAFEARLSSNAELAREVSSLQRLEILARRMAPAEPADGEWERLAKDPLQRGISGLGWVFFVVSVLGLAGWGLTALFTGDLPVLVKLLLGLGISGAAALLLATLRARLRVLPYDPYTHIER